MPKPDLRLAGNPEFSAPESPGVMIAVDRMKRLWGPAVLAAALSVFLPTLALAHPRSSQPTDPSANSPAGVVYSIPVDTARQDAQPHGKGGSGGLYPGGGGGAPPGGTAGGGLPGGGTGPTGGGTGSTGGGAGHSAGANGASQSTGRVARQTQSPVLVPGGQASSLIHSGNGFGSSSQVPGVQSSSPGLGRLQNGSSSPLSASLLAVLVLFVGGFVGFRARRG